MSTEVKRIKLTLRELFCHRLLELFESIKTVSAAAHHPTRLGHVAELLAQFQYSNFGLDHFIGRRHFASLPFFSSALILGLRGLYHECQI